MVEYVLPSSLKVSWENCIWGGRQDSCVGYKDAWGILEDYPRATFAVLDRSGHNLQLESEELFHSLVKEWLYRVEEFKYYREDGENNEFD